MVAWHQARKQLKSHFRVPGKNQSCVLPNACRFLKPWWAKNSCSSHARRLDTSYSEIFFSCSFTPVLCSIRVTFHQCRGDIFCDIEIKHSLTRIRFHLQLTQEVGLHHLLCVQSPSVNTPNFSVDSVHSVRMPVRTSQ